MGDEREISPLNYQRHKVNRDERVPIVEELDSLSSTCKVNPPKRKNSRTEVTEGIALQQSVDQQPNSKLASSVEDLAEILELEHLKLEAVIRGS